MQSALGNLPELFVCIFALRAGLDDVVRAAIVGSVLSNVLLVLGLAFVVGGLKHGTQKFVAPAARNLGLLLLLAVSALMLPALTAALHAPAAGHELAFSRVVAVLLLVVFGLSLPAALARYVVEKGSITVDGVSLTVVEVRDDSFTVSLIPETLARTTLGARQPGDPVNLEVDILAKHVEKLLASGLANRLPAPAAAADPSEGEHP